MWKHLKFHGASAGRRKALSEVQKVLNKDVEPETCKAAAQSNVWKSSSNVDDGRNKRVCNHAFRQMEEEINSAVYRGRNKLDGIVCARCERKMCDKGRFNKYDKENFKPGPNTPAYMCVNIEECEYAICSYCSVDAIEEDKDHSCNVRSRRRA